MLERSRTRPRPRSDRGSCRDHRGVRSPVRSTGVVTLCVELSSGMACEGRSGPERVEISPWRKEHADVISA